MTRLRHHPFDMFMINTFVILLWVCIAIAAPVTETGSTESEKNAQGNYVLRPTEDSFGTYKRAAIATSSKRCAEVGGNILKKNGSAVDAAIASTLCDGVISPQGLGIGGGFLMTIWDAKEKKAYFLNAREYAPAAAYENMFTKDNAQDAFVGGKAIAVPGEIAGYWEAHKRFGKLPWASLFEETIQICEEGSDVSKYVANDVRKVHKSLNDPNFNKLRSILSSKTDSDQLVDYGDKIHRGRLAATLRKIRDYGKDIFYKGEIAQNLVKDIREAGGVLTLQDFENYEPQWKEPVNTTIRDKVMYTSPTPGSGPILAFILNVLQDILPAPKQNIMWQRIAETLKWAYARRNELGDFIPRPEYVDKHTKEDCKINSEDVEMYKNKNYAFVQRDDQTWDKDCLMSVAVKKLLSKEYAAEVQALIEDDKTYNDYEHYNITSEGRIDFGTAHTSVLAEDGSAVSVTSTINHLFGSLVYSESTGIILNNEMDDYSYPGIVSGFGVEPSEFNFVRNGSSTLRPMSSMVPTIILNKDKEVELVIGSAGGTKITSGVAQGIIFTLLLHHDLKKAIDQPRIHHNLWPMKLQREPDFDPKVVEYLEKVGHTMEDWLIMQNTMAAVIRYGPNDIAASGDYRREGGTSGY